MDYKSKIEENMKQIEKINKLIEQDTSYLNIYLNIYSNRVIYNKFKSQLNDNKSKEIGIKIKSLEKKKRKNENKEKKYTNKNIFLKNKILDITHKNLRENKKFEN